jgi:hypothetical protein
MSVVPDLTTCTSDVDCTSPQSFVGYGLYGNRVAVTSEQGGRYAITPNFVCSKHQDGNSYCRQQLRMSLDPGGGKVTVKSYDSLSKNLGQ